MDEDDGTISIGVKGEEPSIVLGPGNIEVGKEIIIRGRRVSKERIEEALRKRDEVLGRTEPRSASPDDIEDYKEQSYAGEAERVGEAAERQKQIDDLRAADQKRFGERATPEDGSNPYGIRFPHSTK